MTTAALRLFATARTAANAVMVIAPQANWAAAPSWAGTKLATKPLDLHSVRERTR